MDALLTKQEVADLIKATPRHVERMVTAGRIPAPVYIGKSVRWKPAVIREWIESGCPAVTFTGNTDGRS